MCVRVRNMYDAGDCGVEFSAVSSIHTNDHNERNA